MLEVRHLVKRFGALAATDGASFQVGHGELHALIGPNGAGKTTLIHQVSGALAPDEGCIVFDGQEHVSMASLDGWRSPVLVIHGDDDRNVSFSETVELVEALRERNVEVEQLILPDEIHSFLRYASWLTVQKATAEFFERRLGPKR